MASDPSHWYKVVGESTPTDGHLDPNENWNDKNHDGLYQAGEDESPIQNLDLDGQIGISRNAQGDLTVTFFADVIGPDGQSHRTLEAVDIAPPGAPNEPTTPKSEVDPSRDDPHYLPRHDYWGAVPVVREGGTLQGAGTVQAIATFDPINDQGQVVFWAKTEKGEFIVRANPIGTQLLLEHSKIPEPTPEDKSVNPIGEVKMTTVDGTQDGVVDQFYGDDNGTFTLTITNTAQNAPNAEPTSLHVEIYVDGPADKFLEGLKTTTNINLGPQGHETITVDELSLRDSLAGLMNDKLYGVHVQIVGWQQGQPRPADEDLLLNQQFNVFRFLAVVDPEGVIDDTPDFKAPFLKTTYNGLVREKMLDYDLPNNVATTFTIEDGNDKDRFTVPMTGVSGKGQVMWKFTPPTDGSPGATYYTAQVNIAVDGQTLTREHNDGSKFDQLTITGTAIPKVQIPLELDGLRAQILAYIAQHTQPDGTYTFQSFFFRKALLNASDDAEAFADAVVASVRATVKAKYMDVPGITIVDGSVPNTTINWTLVVPMDSKGEIYVDKNPTLHGTEVDDVIVYRPYKFGPIPSVGVSLHDVLIDEQFAPKLSLAAKAYALGEGMQQGGVMQFSLPQMLDVWSTSVEPTAEIAGQAVGAKLAHELAHTLGISDAYSFVGEYPREPMDLMTFPDNDHVFAEGNIASLMYAAGTNPDQDPKFDAALKVYVDTFFLPHGRDAYIKHYYPKSEAPDSIASDSVPVASTAIDTVGTPPDVPEPSVPATTAAIASSISPPPTGTTATVASALTSSIDVMPGQAATVASGPVAAALSATTSSDYDHLTVQYFVSHNPYDYPVTLRVYRSQQKEYDRDNPEQVMIADVQLSKEDSTNGEHEITVSADGQYTFMIDTSEQAALRPDPTHQFVITTLDDNGALNPHDVYNTPQAEFRIWLVAAVTHGFSLGGPFAGLNAALLALTNTGFLPSAPPNWVDQMTGDLVDLAKYDYAIDVPWATDSIKGPNGGHYTQLWGYNMALQLQNELPDDLPPEFDPMKDVVDIHFIGHSRGSVVISQALMDINNSNVGAPQYNLGNAPRWLTAGFELMTMLDPHPANNAFGDLSLNESLPSPKKELAAASAETIRRFQSAAQDNNVVVPSNVWAAEDYFQKTDATMAPGLENSVNLWGESVDQIENESHLDEIQSHDMSGMGVGHGEIVDIYQAIVGQGVDDNDFPYTLTQLGLTRFVSGSGTMATSLAIDADQAATSGGGAPPTSADDPADGGVASSFVLEADPPPPSGAPAAVNAALPITLPESLPAMLPPVIADMPAPPTPLHLTVPVNLSATPSAQDALDNGAAVFALVPVGSAGSILQYQVTVHYTDDEPHDIAYLGIDLRPSSAALAPVDPGTGKQDFSAFAFTPAGALLSGWSPIGNLFAGEFAYQTPAPPGTETPNELAPGATYVVGTLSYDLSKFGISPSSSFVISIEGVDTVIGTEDPADHSTFAFIDPTFDPGQITTGAVAVEPTGGFTVSATQGLPTGEQVVATFTDPGGAGPLENYSADIDWGDGSTSAGTITFSAGLFTVTGSHTFVDQGDFPITVTVHHAGAPDATTTSSATVSDAALHGSSQAIAAMALVPFSGSVATFTDDNPGGMVTEYTATIDWGDGTTSSASAAAGTIVAVGGGFEVLGTHVYDTPGDFSVVVTIGDGGGASTEVDETAHVTKASATLELGTLEQMVVYGETAVFSAMLTLDSAGVSGKDLLLSIVDTITGDVHTYTAPTDASGTATWSVGYLGAGTYSVELQFDGTADPIYASVSGTAGAGHHAGPVDHHGRRQEPAARDGESAADVQRRRLGQWRHAGQPLDAADPADDGHDR